MGMLVVKSVTGIITSPQFQDVVYSSFPYSKLTLSTVSDIGTIIYRYDILETGGCYSEISEDPKNNVTKKVYDKAGRLRKVNEENARDVFGEQCGDNTTKLYI